MACGFVLGSALVRPERRLWALGGGVPRAWKYGRGGRRAVVTTCSALVTEGVFTKGTNWAGLCENQGLWEGNVTNYDVDAVETSRTPSSLYVFPEDVGEWEEGGRGPRSAWVQLQRVGKRNAVEFFSCLDDLTARGMVYSPRGDMDASMPQVLRASGAFFEQICNGRDENGTFFGRARLVHVAYRGEGKFSAWTVFRERRALDPLPQYYSEIPSSRPPPDEVAATNHPWLDQEQSELQSSFDRLGGTWTGTTTVVDPSRRTFKELSYSATVQADSDLQATYKMSNGQEIVLVGERVTDRIVRFTNGYELRDLGSGITVVTPPEIPQSGDFFVEMSFQIGARRSRAVRTFTEGKWTSTAFHVETRSS